jgi:hypothetical protein
MGLPIWRAQFFIRLQRIALFPPVNQGFSAISSARPEFPDEFRPLSQPHPFM